MVTPEDVDAAAALISVCPWWTTFDADGQAVIAEADLYVEDQPSELELQLTETGPTQTLLGAMIPPHIAEHYGWGNRAIAKVYLEPVLEVAADPCDAMRHEIGHLPGLDFDHHDEDGCRMCSQPRQRKMPTHQFSDDCPVCNAFRRLSEARGDLDYLRYQAHLTHRVPLGLGGLVPLAQHRCAQAHAELDRAYNAGLLRGREDAAYELAVLLVGCREALNGWLDPEDVSRAADLVNQAWSLAGDLNWWYWAHARHPEVAWAS